MEKTVEIIEGDVEGVSHALTVLRFAGRSAQAPSAYLQAALHAGELPGVVAIDRLVPMLRKAEAEGRMRGRVTVVPAANPIGRAQYHFHELVGRFHLGSRTNFNRDFPLLARPDASLLPDRPAAEDVRLKRRLLQLSIGHDIVLDLHCDDEGVDYLYVPSLLWPGMADCAAAMGVEAVILWEGQSGASFDEASLHPYLGDGAEALARRVVTTVEYRGLADVGYAHAESDAAGLYRLLVARGVMEDATLAPPVPFAGLVATLDRIEMVQAPCAGAILFDVEPGQRVPAGARLATIVRAPGEDGGGVEVLAPQDGIVLTRVAHRSTRAGGDLLKLVGDRRSADARSGALEQ